MIDYKMLGETAAMGHGQVEEWRPIEDFPNYLISSEGRILNRSRGNVLRTYQRGYWVPKVVNLTNGGKGNTRYVKRLVAGGFFQEFRPAWHKVSLMDGDETNCRWDNITFNDGRTGPYTPGNPTVRIRYIIDRDHNLGGAVTLYRSAYDFMELFGGDTRSVYDCLNNRGRQSVYGHEIKWIYLESEVGEYETEPLEIPT